MTHSTSAADLADLERLRLRLLVEARTEEAAPLHSPDFRIVTPGGYVWNKEEYLGGIADGSINYRRFEAISGIDVMFDNHIAIVRYRSAIDIEVAGREPGPLECWHLDCYESTEDGRWQVRWAQATEVGPA